MKRDSRLSGILHVLLHMAEHEGPSTSEALARAMQTNPVVVRRILGGLRERGLVQSERGHGGGWVLARDLAEISLRDVHDAIGGPALLAVGNRSQASDCLVEQAVNAALAESFQEAEAMLLARFGDITLKMLHTDFHARLGAFAGRKRDHVHEH
ncbi:MAG TPA: Rrf2 family transcriptional regulator [Parvibaculum sp.]|jgi:Rrf2 family protein